MFNRQRQTRIFYALSFLGGLQESIVAPFFVVFGLSLGLGIIKVGILFGTIKLAVFIFEIPTGIFADAYGRKKSVLICYFLSILFSLIYFFSSNFYFLLVGSIIGGLALTFFSGAFEALAVDALGLSTKDQFRNKAFVYLTVITTIGFIVGGFAGSGLAYFNLRLIWLFQAAAAVSALVLGWRFLPEKFYPAEAALKRKNVIGIIFDKIKEPAVIVFRDRRISLMFAVSVLMGLAGAFYFVGWPFIFRNILSIPDYYFGLISSAAGIFYMTGAILAEKVSFRRSAFEVIVSSLVLMGVLYIIFGLTTGIILSLLIFVAIDFFNGGFNPLFYSLLNKFVPSAQRATILSFYNLVEGGGVGAGEVLAGKLIAVFSAPLIIFLSPLLIVAALFPLLIIKVPLQIKRK